MNKKKHVMVVEDETTFRLTLKTLLESESYQVTVAADGKIAKDILMHQDVDCILSDVNMPHLTGLALLKYVKDTKPTIRFILMTGFSVLEETHEAHKLGVDEFITKPFLKADLMAILNRFYEPEKPAVALEQQPSADISLEYSKINIEEFVSGKSLKYDIFIKMSEDKFVKIATTGEDLSIERIASYKNKGLHYLYLSKTDYQKYLDMNVVLAKSVSSSKAIPQEKKMRFLKHANDVIMEQLHFNQIDEKLFSSAKIVLDATLAECTETAQCMSLLETLNSHDNSLYAHSLGVSMYAVMIANVLEWKAQGTIDKIALGGLLHDIGKKEIDKAILTKSRTELTVLEMRTYESHVTRGAEILSSISSVSDDILMIVSQHHEDCFGTGYPAKLQRHHIHPMAKVIAVADAFCNLAIRSHNGEPIDPVAAVRRMILLKSGNLDAVSLNALANIFHVEPVKISA
jgi:putative nucleotidyltransferase with HDIG domain